MEIGLIYQFVEVREVFRVQNKVIKLPEIKVQIPPRLQPGGEQQKTLVQLPSPLDTHHEMDDVMNPATNLAAGLSRCQPFLLIQWRRHRREEPTAKAHLEKEMRQSLVRI